MLKIVASNRFKKDLKLAVRRNIDLWLICLPGRSLCQPSCGIIASLEIMPVFGSATLNLTGYWSIV